MIIKKQPSPSVNPVTKLGFNKYWDISKGIRVADCKARVEKYALPSLLKIKFAPLDIDLFFWDVRSGVLN
jgi:hypothetical protein